MTTATQGATGFQPAGAGKRPNAAETARARARVTATERVGKAWGLAATTGVRRWWAWTARPLSLRAAWRASAVDPLRVPAGSPGWAAAWRWSNRTDRLIMFALVLLAPTALTGPLRWIAVRPTRRCGLYLLSILFITYVLI